MSLLGATSDRLLDAALVEETAKKSGLSWIAPEGGAARPVWHVWHAGAVHVLVQRGDGGTEQYVPGLADAAAAHVVLRSKDKGGRIVEWDAAVTVLTSDAAAWADAAAALHGARLNAPDGERALVRWAAECVIVRLDVPHAVKRGAALPSGDQAAAPVGSPATTRGPLPRNYSLGKRLRGR